MIINKDDLAKVEVIGRKMSKLGLGTELEMKKEILNRYVALKMEEVLKND